MGPVIIFICLILIIALAVVVGFFTKGFISSKNLAYFLPLLIVLFFIYYLGYSFQGKVDFITFIECLTGSLKGFKFEIVRSAVQPYMEANVLYAIDVYLAVLLSGITIISGLLGFFKIAIINFFKMLKRTSSRSLDIVFGTTNDAVEYVKKHRNSLLWVDPNLNKLTSDDKKAYFMAGVTYIYQRFTGKRINKYTVLAKGTIHIIVFQKDCEYLKYVLATIDELTPKNGKKYHFHVQSKNELLSFVDEKISAKCRGRIGVIGSSFDSYELAARNFSNQYNLAYFLPRSFFDNGAILPEKDINVIMLGFGKASNAIFRSLLLNNQFVQKVDGKYQAKKINYYLFDKNEDAFANARVAYLKNINQVSKTFKRGLEAIDLPYEIKDFKADVKSAFLKEYLNMFNKDSNSFSYFFICVDSPLENAALANQISNVTSPDSTIIFYNVDDYNEALIEDKANVIPYGFIGKMNSHEYITSDRLWELASLRNKDYCSLKGEVATDLDEKPIVEKQSNIYANLNLKFKLNVLGLDYVSDNDKECLDEKEYSKIYNPNNISTDGDYDYNQYFEINTRTALAYQEHLRWLMFYVLNGFSVLPFADIKYDGNKIIHKDLHAKKHACMIPYYDLDKLSKYESKLTKGKKTVKDVDLYKYDYQILDNLYKQIVNEAGYKIVKLDSKD